MEIDIHYRISRSETTSDKETAKHALLQKKEVVRIVRTRYVSGDTLVVLSTLTEIKNVKHL
jgi:DNA-binding GntR family transcriptional regulator